MSSQLKEIASAMADADSSHPIKMDESLLAETFFKSEVKTPLSNAPKETEITTTQQSLTDTSKKSSESLPPATTTDTQTPTEPQRPENALDASMAIEIGDIILSRACLFGVKLAGKKATASEFALNANEKKKLEPVVAILIEKYLVRASPEVIFAVMLVSIYGGKILVATMTGEDEDKPRKKPAERSKTAVERVSDSTNVKISQGNPKGAGRHPNNCQCEKCLAKKN